MIRQIAIATLLLLDAAVIALLRLLITELRRITSRITPRDRQRHRITRRVNRMAPTTLAYELDAIRQATAEQDLANSEAQGQAQRPLNTPTDQEN